MTTSLSQLPGVREHAAESVRRVLADTGQPLPSEVRADLEPRMNTDFSAVRVHTDPGAQASARQLHANAYTAGSHIVFARDRFAPQTSAGRELLAHELAHTVQQQGSNAVPTAMTRPHEMTRPHDAAETGARAAAAQVHDGTVPTIAPAAATIARDEGTAEVVDTVTNYRQTGTVYSAQMQRDQYATHAEAQRAGTANPAAIMHRGSANISIDTSTGAITVPVSVAVRAALATDTYPPEPVAAIAATRVQAIGDQYIRQVNEGLNNWFTVSVPACQGIPFAGRDLPITVRVARTTAANPDFTIAVNPGSKRSFVSPAERLVMLYAGDLDTMTMRHEGAHMALGVPDEYEELNPAVVAQNPVQFRNERVQHDFPLAGDSVTWGFFSVLRQRHFSFVPAFVHQVLTSMGHPDCRPVLREVNRPQPRLFAISAGLGGSDYRGGALHVDAGVDSGVFLDHDREWRAFLGVHGQANLTLDPGAPSAFLVGARLGFERRWRASRTGPILGLYGESGVAGEWGQNAHGIAPFVGAGAHAGVGSWLSGGEVRLELTGGEVLRLDSEGYHSFHAGFIAGYSW